MPRSRVIPRRALLTGAVAVLVTASTVGAAASSPHPSQAGDVVHTSAGALRGVVTDSYRVFNGVPYAKPPIGDLRWQAPQPAAAWSGTRDEPGHEEQEAPTPQTPPVRVRDGEEGSGPEVALAGSQALEGEDVGVPQVGLDQEPATRAR